MGLSAPFAGGIGHGAGASGAFLASAAAAADFERTSNGLRAACLRISARSRAAASSRAAFAASSR
jgi:hypothetical protein